MSALDRIILSLAGILFAGILIMILEVNEKALSQIDEILLKLNEQTQINDN